METIDYNKVRFGSARFADHFNMKKAGLHDASTGLFLGFDHAGHMVRSQGQAPVLLVGGARSGKNNHIIPWLTDGAIDDCHVINMDWKGQLGEVSQLKINPKIRVINFAPRGSALKTHRMNPTAFIDPTEPSFVADVKLWTESWIKSEPDGNNEFFKIQARRWLESCAVHYCELFGELDLPGFAEIMFNFASEADNWRIFECSMAERSAYPAVRAVADELLKARTSDSPEAGGFQGSKNDVANSFSFLSDPQIMEQISPPYQFDINDLTDPEAAPIQLNIQENMQYREISEPIIKSFYAAAFILKTRAKAKRISTRKQVWIFDEVGNLSGWKLAIDAATFFAGFGIRAIYPTQSFIQLDNLGKNAARIIAQSCGTHLMKGIRQIDEAETVSKICGEATIRVTDIREDLRAEDQIRQAFQDSTFGTGDEILAGMEMQTYAERIGTTTPLGRPLMTASEVIFMDGDLCLATMPGVVPAPMLLNIPPYYTRDDLRGRYLGDSEHDAPGEVSIADGTGGSMKARVIEAPVPDNRKHLPQYGETFHYVEGYHPDHM